MDDDPLQKFIDRLKRHYIVRVAAVYAIASWVIIQLFNNILPNLGLPADSVRFAIIVVALGFPVMLVLTWTFLKPRETASIKQSRWTRLRLKLGSALSMVIIILVCISGWYLWDIAETAHESVTASLRQSSATTPEFSPLPHSIAVLPFKNQSTDVSQQYFSDGITEEITSDLGALPGIRVISWQSTSRYRGTNISITEIGKALNVANILVGSISRDGDRVRVTTELVSTTTGYQLWSAHYDRKLKDIFAIQDDISKAMVSALKLHLSGNRPLVLTATKDTKAHDYYLRGLAASNTRTSESLSSAISDFKQAIRLDKRYARAYAALAWTYVLSHQYTEVPLTESLPKAKRAAQQALRLNKDISTAHVALGAIYLLNRKKRQAQKQLRHALELNPNDLEAHIVYASTLPPSKLKEALIYFKQAAALDPNSATAHYDLGYAYEGLGDYSHAATELQASLGLAPQQVFTRLDLAGLYHRNGDDKSAVSILSGANIGDSMQKRMLNAARLVYQAQQQPSLNNQALTALREIDVKKISPSDKEELVTLYALTGEKYYAIQLLKEACLNAPETCTDIAVNRSYQILRSEPGFQKLSKRYALKNR